MILNPPQLARDLAEKHVDLMLNPFSQGTEILAFAG